MKITDKSLVSIDYTLHLGDGAAIDSSDGEPLTYLHGSGQIVPGLEKALAGRAAGESLELVVPPEEGYGARDPELVHEATTAQFDVSPVPVGLEFIASYEEGFETMGRVTSVEGDKVTVDFNHPLAGKSLHFKVEIREVREATAEELEEANSSCCGGHGGGHGHDHGHGHHGCGGGEGGGGCGPCGGCGGH